MFIKVDENGQITNHWDHADQDLGITTEIPDPPCNAGGFPSLLNSDGNYAYKYINSELITLTEQEILAHPNYKAKQIGSLKAKASFDIQTLDELKAHSIAAKKGEGIELTSDEQSFLTSFLNARQAILDQYELDKQAYE